MDGLAILGGRAISICGLDANFFATLEDFAFIQWDGHTARSGIVCGHGGGVFLITDGDSDDVTFNKTLAVLRGNGDVSVPDLRLGNYWCRNAYSDSLARRGLAAGGICYLDSLTALERVDGNL